ncbi:hypothetical protein [Streptomyces mirabilis]|uniref:hypothetical protein n=1 Tax=Streptomyces mirabilis TaxID=68239 RepID=UPI003720950B
MGRCGVRHRCGGDRVARERACCSLTKENLAREERVSHATVHRAEAILAEWNANVVRPVLRTPGEVQRDQTIAELRRSLRKANEKASELQDKPDALATVTANLYQENIELKKKANRRQQNRLAVLTGGADPDN